MGNLQELYSIITLLSTFALFLFIWRYIASVIRIQTYKSNSDTWKKWCTNGKHGTPPLWFTHLLFLRLASSKELMFFTFVHAVLLSLSILGLFRSAIVVISIYTTIIGGIFVLSAVCFCLLAAITYIDIRSTNEVDVEEQYHRLTSDKDKGQIYRALYGSLVCAVLAATFFNFAGII